jgi:hypothetical protein
MTLRMPTTRRARAALAAVVIGLVLAASISLIVYTPFGQVPGAVVGVVRAALIYLSNTPRKLL